jgi:hypothetical protein
MSEIRKDLISVRKIIFDNKPEINSTEQSKLKKKEIKDKEILIAEVYYIIYKWACHKLTKKNMNSTNVTLDLNENSTFKNSAFKLCLGFLLKKVEILLK